MAWQEDPPARSSSAASAAPHSPKSQTPHHLGTHSWSEAWASMRTCHIQHPSQVTHSITHPNYPKKLLSIPRPSHIPNLYNQGALCLWDVIVCLQHQIKLCVWFFQFISHRGKIWGHLVFIDFSSTFSILVLFGTLALFVSFCFFIGTLRYFFVLSGSF